VRSSFVVQRLGESNPKGHGRREALRRSGEQAVARADRMGRRRTADLSLAKTRTPLGDTKRNWSAVRSSFVVQRLGESNPKGHGRREALLRSGEQAVVRADRAGRRRTADLPLAKTRTPLGDTSKESAENPWFQGIQRFFIFQEMEVSVTALT